MFQRGDGRGADAEFPETERHEALRGARVGGQFAAHPGFDTRPVRGVEYHADAALHGRVECVAKVGYAGVSAVGSHHVLRQVVGADAEKPRPGSQFVGDEYGGRSLDHHPQRYVAVVGNPFCVEFRHAGLDNRFGGAELPDSGKVVRKSRVSWPIGFAGGFHGSLTGRENLRFTSRIYGSDIRKVTEFVEDFSELGPYMDMPVRTYSSGMKSKLAFGLSMAIGFDFYLIDEAYSVGDAAFQAKGERVFQERKASSTLIVVSHSVSTIRKNCDNAAVLFGGKLMCFANLEDALTRYQEICDAQKR